MNTILKAIRTSRYLQWAFVFFLIGCLLHVYLALRSWMGGDQVYLLSIGLDYSLRGEIHPFAKLMSGAGANPGILLQLLVGIPLMVIPHFQSPMILIVLFHIIAGFLFLSVLYESMGERAVLIGVLVFWLSPWRLYNSGFLWEPSYIFLPAAAHFWACYKSRNHASTPASFVLGLALLAGIQIHNSSFLLILFTAYLFIRESLRIKWVPFMIGTITGALTLIPTLLAMLNGQLPAGRESSGYIGWSLVHIYPALKGIVYWFTLGALDMVRPLKETIFLSDQFLSLHGKWNVMSISIYFLQMVCVLTVFVSVYASWWWFWKSRKSGYSSDEKIGWFRRYTTGGAVCLFISAALSPIVLQGWQVVLMLHAAVLPVLLWVELVFLRSGDKPKRWMWLGIYTAVEILLVLVLAQGLYIFSNPGIVPEAVQHNQELFRILHLP